MVLLEAVGEAPGFRCVRGYNFCDKIVGTIFTGREAFRHCVCIVEGINVIEPNDVRSTFLTDELCLVGEGKNELIVDKGNACASVVPGGAQFLPAVVVGNPGGNFFGPQKGAKASDYEGGNKSDDPVPPIAQDFLQAHS